MTENEVKQAFAEQESRKLKDEVEEALEEIDLSRQEITALASLRRIRGRTLEAWEADFSIAIDPNGDPAHVNLLLQKLSKNLDTAHRWHNRSKFEKALFNCHYNPEIRKKISTEANRKGRKTPSLDTMSKLAEDALGSKTVIQEYYNQEIKFWDKMIERVRTQLGLVNTLAMSNGTRYKIGEPLL